jgi:cytochrome bd-type quinol oxidase subunit 2
MKKITKTLTQIFTGVGAALTLWTGKALALSSVQEGANAAHANGMPTELFGDAGVFTRITNILLFAIGIVSVIMLIYGGLRYVTSGGDQKKVTDAKNTVLYAIIGLIVAVLSFAIVNFVLQAIGASNPINTTIDSSTSEVQQ